MEDWQLVSGCFKAHAQSSLIEKLGVTDQCQEISARGLTQVEVAEHERKAYAPLGMKRTDDEVAVATS